MATLKELERAELDYLEAVFRRVAATAQLDRTLRLPNGPVNSGAARPAFAGGTFASARFAQSDNLDRAAAAISREREKLDTLGDG